MGNGNGTGNSSGVVVLSGANVRKVQTKSSSCLLLDCLLDNNNNHHHQHQHHTVDKAQQFAFTNWRSLIAYRVSVNN